jgi:hypothetical protein
MLHQLIHDNIQGPSLSFIIFLLDQGVLLGVIFFGFTSF